MDANNLVGVYPFLVGTRLDDCQTCHSGRIEGGQLAGSACDNCHDLLLHGAGTPPPGPGKTAFETLNEFGRDYLEAGRSQEALRSVREGDSDGDGFSNADEIRAGRYPGNDGSMPGQAFTPVLTVTLEELRALPSHRESLLLNNTQQRFDDYAIFDGVTVADLLDAENIDLSGATGITFIAPDGFMKSYPIELVAKVFPEPVFLPGLDIRTLGEECGFVRYPEALLDRIEGGSPVLGEQRLMLAYGRDGFPLEEATLDVMEGKMLGEGPLRLVVPQEDPGVPDRGSAFSPSGCEDGFDFRSDADHNAGSMVRGVIAIRIDPMPPGIEEFDYMNGGWGYVSAGQVILYGHGVG